MDVERGVAWRRRQRRLRSWWRHEQQTVAAVLATVTHHSHSKVGTANAVLRGQKTGTSTRVMRTGAGWRRRPGVVSRGVWHPLISLHACMGMEKHTHATTVSEPPPTPTPPPPTTTTGSDRFSCVSFLV